MAKRLAKKVVLIGWDAADWQHMNPLLDEGLMPGLERLIERGVMGNLTTLQPVLSPMLWNSIATGKTADKHGILGFTEPLAGLRGIRPSSSRSRQVHALWNILHREGLRSNVVGWWASHPAEPIRGSIVSNLFNGIKRSPQGSIIAKGVIHPPDRTAELGSLKVDISEIGPDDVLPFIPRAAEINQDEEKSLETFSKILADAASLHAVTTKLMERDDWDFTAIYLEAIDHFCHAFMQFHPPRMPTTPEPQFELYKDVVRNAYRFHDMMLERLVYLAGEDAAIVLCSDHGFQSQHMRPTGVPLEPAGPAAWHRDLGVVAMAGPGLKPDHRIYGASILDITPTILHLFGLPVGADMDGRVLLDAFEEPTEPRMIPSWENVPGDFGRLDPGTPEEESASADELIKQFVALGYIDDPGDDKHRAAEICGIEQKYNLARVYSSTSRPAEAFELLRGLVAASPWDDRYWKHLAVCCWELGYHRQAAKIWEQLYRDVKQVPTYALALMARAAFELRDVDRAEELVEQALARPTRLPNLTVTLGQLLMRRRRFDEAEAAFRRAIEIDPEHAPAYVALSTLFLRLGRNEEAVDAALDAVSTLFRLPRAHWNLGIGLTRLGDYEKAARAFQILLQFDEPRYEIAARQRLAHLYIERLGRKKEGHEILRLNRERMLERAGGARRRQRRERAEQLIDLPEIPSVPERAKALRRERPQLTQGKPGSSGKTFVLVSGLPRSGTSLMMQMLAAGGLPPQTDGQRTADEDNPEGYYEWEDIKQIGRKPDLLLEKGLEGKVIKTVSALLAHLPVEHNYLIVFMTRPTDEVAASQREMIRRRGTEGTDDSDEAVARRLESHRAQTERWMASQPNVQAIVVDYPELVRDPAPWVDRLVTFLGPERLPDSAAMHAVVRPELHRHRSVS